MPTAVIITTEFVTPAKTIAASQGIPDYPFAVVSHPIGSATETVLKERAEDAFQQVLNILWRR